MKNFYSEKPVVKYEKTTVPMSTVVTYLKGLHVPLEIKRAVYIIFRIESANGTKGINHNYCGFQADSGRWPDDFDPVITGVVQLAENGTGRQRLFLAFRDYRVSVNFLAERVMKRGLYVGGTTHRVLTMAVRSPKDLCRAYKKEWVKGSAAYEPSEIELKNFLSMYKQAEKLFV